MRRPPKLIARTLVAAFGTAVVILSIVFAVLMVDARRRVRSAETEKLGVAGRVFTALEARRQQEQLATIATIAENPTLKAALDTYVAERQFADMPADQETSLRGTDGHGHGEAAGDEDGRVQGAPAYRQGVAALDEGGQVLETVDGIAAEEAAEKHDLLGDEGPHAHVGGLVLLLQVVEVVLQGTGVGVIRHRIPPAAAGTAR